MSVLTATAADSYIRKFTSEVEASFKAFAGIHQATLNGVVGDHEEGNTLQLADIVDYAQFVTYHSMMLGHHLLKLAAAHLRRPVALRITQADVQNSGSVSCRRPPSVEVLRFSMGVSGLPYDHAALGRIIKGQGGGDSERIGLKWIALVSKGLDCAGYAETKALEHFVLAPKIHEQVDTEGRQLVQVELSVAEPAQAWF